MVIEETLTIDEHADFLRWMNQFDDAWGKHFIDNLEDLAMRTWDNPIEQSNVEKQAKETIFRRFDEFVRLHDINLSQSILRRLEEKRKVTCEYCGVFTDDIDDSTQCSHF